MTDEEILAVGREIGKKCRLGGNPNVDFDYAREIEKLVWNKAIEAATKACADNQDKYLREELDDGFNVGVNACYSDILELKKD